MNKIKVTFSVFIIAFVFVFVALVTYNLVEPKVYDFMTKQFLVQKLPFDKYKKVHGSDDIVLVMIDSKTVEQYRWPWKRDFDSKILGYFHEYTKPKVIVDDFIFMTLDKEYPQADKVFFNRIKPMKNYVAGFFPSMNIWKDLESGKKYEKLFAKKYSIKVENKELESYTPYHSMLQMPYQYLNSVQNLGHVFAPNGALNKNISNWAFDNVVRSNEYIIKYENAYYPSLAFKAYLLIKNPQDIIIKNRSIDIQDNDLSIKLLNKSHLYQNWKKLVLDTYSNPIRFYKIYNGTPYSHKFYSVSDVVSSYESIKKGQKPVLSPELFKDKIVVLGVNVPAGTGMNDNKNSSILANHPGVDIQATVLDNIVNNDFLTVIPNFVNFMICVILMIAFYSFIRFFNLATSVVYSILLLAFYLLICSTCFYFGIVINVITPVVMAILTTILAYIHRYLIENKAKEKVKFAMGKYMSQDVMKEVVDNIDNLGLGGKKSVVTVLFADIRGFTTMSEQMSAQEVSEILNEYFTEMEPIITRYNGVINKFIGDAVMAIFGEPIQDKNHAKNAVKCAYAMLKRVEALQKKWERVGKPKIEIGIGINTGEVFVGNIGSVNRMEYTVIGDTVNIASRLESYNKKYSTHLLISPATYSEVRGFTDVIKIPDVLIRGRTNKMDIYEVLKVVL